MTGCASQPGLLEPAAAGYAPGAIESDQYYWWYARFSIDWSEAAEQPDWDIDLLLADAVIKPVLLAHRQALPYWRFHRRAGRDGAGHQFSFIFYSDPPTAGAIYNTIRNDPVITDLLREKIILSIVTDDPAANQRTRINDTSDPHWSLTLQQAWPAYIMGVSAMWLDLIGQNMERAAAGAGIHDLIQRYRAANTTISQLWRNEGQHALLHHLNAIFGYEPLSIEKQLTF